MSKQKISLKFLLCLTLVFFIPGYSSNIQGIKLADDQEITDYISHQISCPLSIALMLNDLRDQFEQKGFVSPKISTICENIQNRFPHLEIIEDVYRETLRIEAYPHFLLVVDSEKDKEEDSRHFVHAVETYLWGTAEIAFGVFETVRGDVIGGAFCLADGVRNYKQAWNELQEAIAEKEEKEREKDADREKDRDN